MCEISLRESFVWPPKKRTILLINNAMTTLGSHVAFSLSSLQYAGRFWTVAQIFVNPIAVPLIIVAVVNWTAEKQFQLMNNVMQSMSALFYVTRTCAHRNRAQQTCVNHIYSWAFNFFLLSHRRVREAQWTEEKWATMKTKRSKTKRIWIECAACSVCVLRAYHTELGFVRIKPEWRKNHLYFWVWLQRPVSRQVVMFVHVARTSHDSFHAR